MQLTLYFALSTVIIAVLSCAETESGNIKKEYEYRSLGSTPLQYDCTCSCPSYSKQQPQIDREFPQGAPSNYVGPAPLVQPFVPPPWQGQGEGQNQEQSAHTFPPCIAGQGQGQGQSTNSSWQGSVRPTSPRPTNAPATGNCAESLIDECAARKNPCKNNERCIDEVRGFTCIDDCAVRNSCLNGGTCVNGRDNSTCICAYGFTGSTCGCSLPGSIATLPVISLGCGGLIEIPNFPERTSFLLDYKSNVVSNNTEHCLWTFNNVNYAKSLHYIIRIQVTLQCEGFLSSGGALSVLDWKEIGTDWTLSNNVLSGSGQSYAPTSINWKQFLSYSSGSSPSPRSGFVVLVNVLQAFPDLAGSNFAYTVAAGTRNHGPYLIHDKLSIVVNPPQGYKTLTVNYLDSKRTTSCFWEDTLDIFEIGTVLGPQRLDRMCLKQ